MADIRTLGNLRASLKWLDLMVGTQRATLRENFELYAVKM